MRRGSRLRRNPDRPLRTVKPLKAKASPERRPPRLSCGTGYPTIEAALRSKRAQAEGAIAEKCANPACPKWHVRSPATIAPVRKPSPARRETGFPVRVRVLIRTRAGAGDIDAAECEGCGVFLGRFGGDLQHRAARGAGGCRDTVINGPANGLLLCRDCHAAAESRDEHLGGDGAGWWLKHGTTPELDPRNCPVLWHARGGSGVLLWLSETGEYLYSDPEARAA